MEWASVCLAHLLLAAELQTISKQQAYATTGLHIVCKLYPTYVCKSLQLYPAYVYSAQVLHNPVRQKVPCAAKRFAEYLCYMGALGA
jgi:hypothetical protein